MSTELSEFVTLRPTVGDKYKIEIVVRVPDEYEPVDVLRAISDTFGPETMALIYNNSYPDESITVDQMTAALHGWRSRSALVAKNITVVDDGEPS